MPTAVTITLGNSGKDYTTLHAATAGTEIINRVANDEAVLLRCYNTDNIAITASVASIAAGAAANNVTIEPAPGEDYTANDYNAKALRYDPADGVAFNVVGSFGAALILNGDSNTQVNNLMFLSTAHITTTIYGNGFNSTVTGCIMQEDSNANRSSRMNYENCLFIRTANLGIATLTAQFGDINQCSFVCPADLVSTQHATALHGNDVTNCAVFGYDTSTAGTAGGGSDFNATDVAAIDGTNPITLLTYADQFKNINDATQDWGMKAGNDLDGAGAGGVDIGYRIPPAIPGGGANITAAQNEQGDSQTAALDNVVSIAAGQSEQGDSQTAALVEELTGAIVAIQAEAGDITNGVLLTQPFTGQTFRVTRSPRVFKVRR